MDKFQMFLPFSGQPTCSFEPDSSSMKLNPYLVNDQLLQEDSNDGFLGFSSESIKNDSIGRRDIISSSSVSNQLLASGSEGDEGKPGGNKRKWLEKKVRRPRYAFQTRSQVDILDDGYRWRKYGQKAVKANKFPRSYYRCTHQGCNVKKQVQRLTKDEGVVVTTYEGMHSHSIEKPTDNFEHILSQMQIFTSNPF